MLRIGFMNQKLPSAFTKIFEKIIIFKFVLIVDFILYWDGEVGLHFVVFRGYS